MLGSNTSEMIVIDPSIMNSGHVLTREQQLHHIAPISFEEVTSALKDCADLKTQGYDVYDLVFFFKKTGTLLDQK